MTEDDARSWVAARVSRETVAALEDYVRLVPEMAAGDQPRRAQHTGPNIRPPHRRFASTFDDLRIEDMGHWVDFGSGAGFPGLVCAIAAKDHAPGLTFTLIESDQRKASFLREVARTTGVKVKILVTRIEDAPPQNAQIISARALAPLAKLCEFSKPHMANDGIALFPKGRNHVAEQADADAGWTMNRDIWPSRTDPSSVIYRIGDLTRV